MLAWQWYPVPFIHDGQRPILLSRIGQEYDRNWSPVPVQNTLVTGLERRIQSVLDSEMSISIHYLLGFTRFWHDFPTYSGPEKETNSAHILRLFWGVVLAVACRDRAHASRSVRIEQCARLCRFRIQQRFRPHGVYPSRARQPRAFRTSLP